ncbi:MAG: DNA polymerase III subunit beta [Acidimicrobiales bacterium]|nr:DNA polymerase III subunit beta [Acidimicrobiales bacterium]
MKFRCERDVLVEALGSAGRAAAGRGTSLPVLSGVRVELSGNQLRLTGTDLELTITAEVAVSGGGDGVVILPGRLASDIVRALPAGSVEVEVDDDEARISAGRSEFSLRVLPADEFPRLPEPGGDPVTLASAELATALAQVVRAASTDDARPVLTGVLLAAEAAGLRLVATDSYRLAIRDLPGTTVLAEGQHVLVPSRALQELARVLTSGDTLSVRLGERDASFEVGGTRLTTVLIEGEFPPYERLIPQAQPNRLTVGREALLEAVRRVKLLAREATPVRLAMSSEGLELVAITQDVGQAHETLDAKFEGTELTVAFNPEYLVQGIEVAPGDEVSIETVDALKPAILRCPEHPEFLYLLMPVRVS